MVGDHSSIARNFSQHSSNSNCEYLRNIWSDKENESPNEGRAKRVTSAPGLKQQPGASGISKKVVNSSKSRMRPGKIFFITLSGFDYYRSVRVEFVKNIKYIFPLLTYCVAVEKSNVSKLVSYHLHAFLEFDCKLFIENLKDVILSLYFDCRLNIQACRSRKSCLKYISKEDKNLIFNCKLSELHFAYRAYHWALNTNYFLFSDPFVLEHRFCYNFLKKLHGEVQQNKVLPFVLFKKVEFCYKNWTMEVALWWNSNYNSSKVKRKQLYLYGPTNFGKSSYVENLIGKSNLPYVFYPGVGHFFMQGFKADFHKIILFEEFEISHYYSSYLKRLLEGRSFAYPVKCDADKIIKFNGMIIFVSNFLNINDAALLSRLCIVYADEAYWSSEETLLPKEEILSEDEAAVISLSSSQSSFSSVSSFSSEF